MVGYSLEAVVPEHRLQRAAGVAHTSAELATVFKLQKSIGGALQICTVTIPPGLLPERQPVDVDILGLDQFEQARLAVRAAPSAGTTATVGSFGNCEVADDVVDHNGSGAQLPGDGLAPACIARPDARRKGKSRLVCARDGLLGVVNGLNGENRPEGLLLKKTHCRIDIGNHGWLEKIRTQVRARMTAAKHLRAPADGVLEQIANVVDVLGDNQL